MNTLPPGSSDQIADPDLLEQVRCSLRRKALEYLTEADRLDALYAAVTGTSAGNPQPDSDSNPDGGPI